MNLLKTIEHQPRAATMAGCIGFLALIGIVDYLTGFEVFFSVFYLLAVSAGTWFVSRGFGLAISCLSASAWIAGDVAAGAHYSSSFIPVWNTAILLAFYFIVVWLLASLRALHRNLEIRVQERTQALTIEMGERERLEKEILEISEREQRRIGRDLHDSICQHLTATALAGQVLEEKLSARSIPEAADASKIVQLVEEGINLSRSLAHGILPVDLDSEGLVSAMQELCGGITRTGHILRL